MYLSMIFNCSNDNTVHHSSGRPTITYTYIYNCSNDTTVHHSSGRPTITYIYIYL